MFRHSTTVRVRYGETDQMGYVYYGNYALYYEIGRVEALRSLGLSYRSLEEKGIMMPVVRVESKFIRPATYDDQISIRTTIKELPKKLITFHVQINRAADERLHEAKVTLYFHDINTGKMVSAPNEIVDRLKPYF